MNVFRMNVIWTYSTTFATLSLSRDILASVVSLYCHSHHFENCLELSSHPGTFSQLVHEYCEFGHTFLVTYCTFLLLFYFCPPYSWVVCDFGCSQCLYGRIIHNRLVQKHWFIHVQVKHLYLRMSHYNIHNRFIQIQKPNNRLLSQIESYRLFVQQHQFIYEQTELWVNH